jgi:hypothetical protein
MTPRRGVRPRWFQPSNPSRNRTGSACVARPGRRPCFRWSHRRPRPCALRADSSQVSTRGWVRSDLRRCGRAKTLWHSSAHSRHALAQFLKTAPGCWSHSSAQASQASAQARRVLGGQRLPSRRSASQNTQAAKHSRTAHSQTARPGSPPHASAQRTHSPAQATHAAKQIAVDSSVMAPSDRESGVGGTAFATVLNLANRMPIQTCDDERLAKPASRIGLEGAHLTLIRSPVQVRIVLWKSALP